MAFLAFIQSSIQLVPDGTIFLHIALILLMIWILNRTLFKPVNRILTEREMKTGGRFGAADDILRQSKEKLTAYEQGIRQARAEGYSVIEQKRMAALASREQQINAVKTEVDSKLAEEKAALQAQVAKARTELQTDAQALAERISSNILKQAT